MLRVLISLYRCTLPRVQCCKGGQKARLLDAVMVALLWLWAMLLGNVLLQKALLDHPLSQLTVEALAVWKVLPPAELLLAGCRPLQTRAAPS